MTDFEEISSCEGPEKSELFAPARLGRVRLHGRTIGQAFEEGLALLDEKIDAGTKHGCASRAFL